MRLVVCGKFAVKTVREIPSAGYPAAGACEKALINRIKVKLIQVVVG